MWEILLLPYMENTSCRKVLTAYILSALLEIEKCFHLKFLICRHSKNVSYLFFPLLKLHFTPFIVLK